jgi:hypothetical protein
LGNFNQTTLVGRQCTSDNPEPGKNSLQCKSVSNLEEITEMRDTIAYLKFFIG